MIDFRKILIKYEISYLSMKLSIRKFNINIGKYKSKYKILLSYELTNDTKKYNEMEIDRIYFNNIYEKLLKTDFENIKNNNPELIARRDGSSTELWIKNGFRKIYAEIFVLEHFHKKYPSMEYLFNIIVEILSLENIELKNIWIK